MIKFLLKIACAIAIISSSILLTSCNKENIDSEVVENYVNQSVYELQERSNCGKFGCFEFVFPISVEFPDGSTQAVNSYDDLRAIIADWKENNADAEERPSLAFPLEVVSEEGEAITVADKSELRTLAKACKRGYYGKNDWKGHRGKHGGKGMGSHGDRCFELVFPISVEYPDGSTESYEDATSLKTALRAWRTANRGAEERPTVVFPVTVEFEDSTTQSVESRDALRDLKDTCSEGV